jgi:hypothetical protein
VKIDREMFEEWLASPVTEFVLRYALETAEQNKAMWMQVSWDAGDPDPRKLVEYKARYEANKDLNEIEWKDVEAYAERKRDLSN